MKITIESIKNRKNRAKLILELNGNKYTEIWYRDDNGGYTTEGESVISQVEDKEEDFPIDDLDAFLSEINMDDFIDLAHAEQFDN